MQAVGGRRQVAGGKTVHIKSEVAQNVEMQTLVAQRDRAEDERLRLQQLVDTQSVAMLAELAEHDAAQEKRLQVTSKELERQYQEKLNKIMEGHAHSMSESLSQQESDSSERQRHCTSRLLGPMRTGQKLQHVSSARRGVPA